jgi:hypothetical protein
MEAHILAVRKVPMEKAVKNRPVIVPRRSSVPRRCSTIKEAKEKLIVAQKPSANITAQLAIMACRSSCFAFMMSYRRYEMVGRPSIVATELR